MTTAASSGSSSGPESIEIGQRPGGYAQRSQSLGRKLQRPATGNATPILGEQHQRPYTAEDVVTILRSSVRHRPPPRQNVSIAIATTLPRPPVRMSTHLEDASFRSIENLVLNAEPPDQTPGVGAETNHSDSNSNSNINSNSNNTSVI